MDLRVGFKRVTLLVKIPLPHHFCFKNKIVTKNTISPIKKPCYGAQGYTEKQTMRMRKGTVFFLCENHLDHSKIVGKHLLWTRHSPLYQIERLNQTCLRGVFKSIQCSTFERGITVIGRSCFVTVPLFCLKLACALESRRFWQCTHPWSTMKNQTNQLQTDFDTCTYKESLWLINRYFSRAMPGIVCGA